MNDSIREVLAEMRGRKINHGRDASPTLEAWAERIETALRSQPVSRDREVLLYLMQQFDSESWECPKCGHSEDTETMDSADYLRKFLEGSRAASRPVPEQARELLAAECYSSGWFAQAHMLRNNSEALSEYGEHFNIALRAIEAALSSTAGGEAVAWQFKDSEWTEWASITEAQYDSYRSGRATGSGNSFEVRALYTHTTPQSVAGDINDACMKSGGVCPECYQPLHAENPVAGDAVWELPESWEEWADKESAWTHNDTPPTVLRHCAKELRSALGKQSAKAVCKTCGGHGLIGGHSGQTPGQYEEHGEPCPDCTQADSQRVPDEKYPDDGNGDDDAYNAGFNECRRLWIAAAPSPAASASDDIAIAFRALANKWYARAADKENGDQYDVLEMHILRSCANEVYQQVGLVIDPWVRDENDYPVMRESERRVLVDDLARDVDGQVLSEMMKGRQIT
jgi:hypothetical protein